MQHTQHTCVSELAMRACSCLHDGKVNPYCHNIPLRCNMHVHGVSMLCFNSSAKMKLCERASDSTMVKLIQMLLPLGRKQFDRGGFDRKLRTHTCFGRKLRSSSVFWYMRSRVRSLFPVSAACPGAGTNMSLCSCARAVCCLLHWHMQSIGYGVCVLAPGIIAQFQVLQDARACPVVVPQFQLLARARAPTCLCAQCAVHCIGICNRSVMAFVCACMASLLSFKCLRMRECPGVP